MRTIFTLRFWLFFLLLDWSVFFNESTAATVKTTRGVREGSVIVRESADRLVITILTQDKRLFQFYARDIESITATEKNLIGKPAAVLIEPASDAPPAGFLVPGQEVQVLEKKSITQTVSPASVTETTPITETTDWIKIRSGMNLEGWIPADQLTDNVVFTSEEKSIPYKKNRPGSRIPSATESSIPENPLRVEGDKSP